MNRIVREQYPVSKLPEDLREGFGPNDEVRVTIDRVFERAVRDPAAPGLFSQFKHLRQQNYRSIEEVDEYVRSLRDEWSHRER